MQGLVLCPLKSTEDFPFFLCTSTNAVPPWVGAIILSLGLLFFAKMLRSPSSLSHTCWISYFSIRLSHEGIAGTVNRRRIDFTSTFNPTDSFPKVRVPSYAIACFYTPTLWHVSRKPYQQDISSGAFLSCQSKLDVMRFKIFFKNIDLFFILN
jgi:hypothetical protein